MEIPCDTIGQAVSDYLDAGDFTAASRTTYRRVLEGMARALGPGRAVTELDAGELGAWFQHTRSAHGPATWNRDRVIVRSFLRHLQRQGAAVELPALAHRRLRPDTTRALPRARVEQLLTAPARATPGPEGPVKSATLDGRFRTAPAGSGPAPPGPELPKLSRSAKQVVSLEVTLNVPVEAGAIAFGVRLRGRGAVHVADLQLGAVGARTSRPPRNLDFSDDA